MGLSYSSGGGGGASLPAGGTTDQILAKQTDADFDTIWTTPSGGGSFDPASPGAIGGTTPARGDFSEVVSQDNVYAAGFVVIGGHAELAAFADGVITLYNTGVNGFSMLQFGGLVAANPALKVSGTDLEFVQADGSNLNTGIILSSPSGNRFRVQVDDSGLLNTTAAP